MITDVIRGILIADGELKKLVKRIEPSDTEYTGNCILYTLSPISDDGSVRVDRLQLTVISGDMDTLEAADRRVRKLLLTPDDRAVSDTNIMQITVNGGGTLRDDARKKHHRILYLQITSRSDLYE